uniref:Zinc-ribbon domain protein n=1 Tax=Siphoviridae sp. cto6l14 TaxID=2827590 RepID=A0A8S5LPI4_9CAUD|nr:MAG TPA: zinc-ribbon domain protein [Siphoviridae sp. cto6l14]
MVMEKEKDLIEKLQDGEHILCYDCQKSYYVPFSAPAKKSLEFYCKNCHSVVRVTPNIIVD